MQTLTDVYKMPLTYWYAEMRCDIVCRIDGNSLWPSLSQRRHLLFWTGSF